MVIVPSKIDVAIFEKTRGLDSLLGASASTIAIDFDPENRVHRLCSRGQAGTVFPVRCRRRRQRPRVDAAAKKWKDRSDRNYWDFTGQASSNMISTMHFSAKEVAIR